MKKNGMKVPLFSGLKKLFKSELLAVLLVTFIIIVNTSISYPQNTGNQFTVKGIVTDATSGLPLTGIIVQTEGGSDTLLTDSGGKFSVNISEKGSVLVFSLSGYKSKHVKVGRQQEISVALVSNLAAADEMIAVGYGMQDKGNLLGAVYQIQGNQIAQKVQGSDLRIALIGELPGLVLNEIKLISEKDYCCGSGGIITSDNSDFSLNIRGIKTWNNSSALVLVDGVERPLENINPYEIDRISLLKDASSTSVFGVKGANGVVLITTRRGEEGKLRLEINGNISIKSLSDFPESLGSYDVNLMRNYAILNEVPYNRSSWDYIVPDKYLAYYKSQKYPEYLPDVDWNDVLIKDYAFDQTVNMNLTGGTKFIKYFSALSYTHEGDMFKISDIGQGYSPDFLFNRFNFRSNFDFDLTPVTRISVNLQGFFSERQSPRTRIYSSLFSRPPDLYPVRYSDGTWADYRSYPQYENSLYLLDMFGYQSNRETSLTSDFILSQKLDFITRGLNISGKISSDNDFLATGPSVGSNGAITKFIQPQIVDEVRPGMSLNEIKALEEKYTVWQTPSGFSSNGFDWVQPPNTYSTENTTFSSTYRNFYYELEMNYIRDFGKHSVTGLGLFSRQQAATGSSVISYREDWVGRLTYGFDKRYMLELNGAYNGSEKFGPENRFGFFPAFAVGWLLSNEAFFQWSKPVVSFLKLRYSDGKTGSDAGIPRWLYTGSWITTSERYFPYLTGWENPVTTGPLLRYQGVLPNPDIQWETSRMKNYGLETGFFNDLLKVNFDYFSEKRRDIFVNGTGITVPVYLGAAPVSANLGQVNIHGFEFELKFSVNTPSGFNYWFNHSWTYAKDKIINRADRPITPWYQKQKGFQIGQPWVSRNQSLYPMKTWNDIYNAVGGTTNTSLLPGDYCIVDYNSDGFTDSNDMIPFGYTERPQYTYSPSAGISWKSISASLRFFGVYNVQGSSEEYRRAFSGQYNTVYPWNRMLAWSPEFNNTATALNPGLRFMTGSRSGSIDNPISYVLLQNAELAYSFSSRWLNEFGISNLKLTLRGDNLHLWTKTLYNFSGTLAREYGSIDYGSTPRSYSLIKRINCGLSFNFR
jgi:TonB-linked SusC/RagA family outer membrane protein